MNKSNFTCIKCADEERFKTRPTQSLAYTFHNQSTLFTCCRCCEWHQWRTSKSYTVAVIFAITRVVNNYNIRTKLCFLNQTEPNSFWTESEFSFEKPNRNQQEFSYHKQIARQLCTQYVEGIYMPKYYTVTLKSRLRVTQRHWKWNRWIDHTPHTISRFIWRWILWCPWNVG